MSTEDCSSSSPPTLAEEKPRKIILNTTKIACDHCGSLILLAGKASLQTSELVLPRTKTKQDTETSRFVWSVPDMFTFENIAFSHTVGIHKYLACAECEKEVIGVHNTAENTFLLAHDRLCYDEAKARANKQLNTNAANPSREDKQLLDFIANMQKSQK